MSSNPMRVVLVQPPIRDFYRTRFREYPLGLLYLAGSLERNGIEAHLIDGRLRGGRLVPLPPELAHLDAYYGHGTALFAGYRHFGMDHDEIARQAALVSPHAVCISAMFTPYENEAVETARAIRRLLPHVFIVAGGCHATADPCALMNSGAFDCIVRGEAEEALPAVVRHSEDYRGRVVPEEGEDVLRIADLDLLAVPARHLIDPAAYRIGRRRYAMVLTSRGCPHRCTFCSTHTVAGHEHRVRDTDAVIDEVRACVARFGVRAIDLQDDNLLHRPERIKTLLERAASEFGDVEFMATNGVNARDVDREMITLMKRAGFRKLDLALGTGDVAARAGLARPERIDHYERVVAWAAEEELPVTTYVILGIPTQPVVEMRATVDYLKRTGTLIAPSVFYNVPGMPCFDDMRKYERVGLNIARRGTAFDCDGVDFTRDDIHELVCEIREYNIGLKDPSYACRPD